MAKNRNARRLSELEKRRSEKTKRMRNPMGTSAYARKVEMRGNSHPAWVSPEPKPTAPRFVSPYSSMTRRELEFTSTGSFW